MQGIVGQEIEDGKQDMNNPFPSISSIAYIIEKFPSPTEYFVLNEILELEKKGFEITLLVLKRRKRYENLPELNKLKATIFYLPKFHYYFPLLSIFLEPFSAFRFLISSLSFSVSRFLKAIRYYSISLYFVNQLKQISISHIHAHFAFISVDIAHILSQLLKVKFSFTAHAQDIYTNESRIKQAVNNALFTITCTKYNNEYLNRITDYKFKEKIFTVYHGIEVAKWMLNGIEKRFDNSIIHILSIARLVEKKGLIYLLKSVQILIGQCDKVKCTIIGEGKLQKQLKEYIHENRLHNFVQILDFMSQEKLKKHFAESDIFVLPCVVAENGDRDGLPNVILEAMAIGIPVISTPVSAIPEIIKDKKTGLLVREKDEKVLANAIQELKNNKELYSDIANNSKQRILEEFAIENCTEKLIEILQTKIKAKVE